MSSDPAIDISVVVVNYGTAELTIAAVESVLTRSHGGRRVDVHLVDNASPNGDGARLAAAMTRPGWAGRVHFYPETVNHGFGRGNNLVFRRLAAQPVPPRHVFLLNPDARLDNEAIAILADTLEANPQAGFAGAAVERPDSGAATAAFRFPSLLSEFSHHLAFGPVAKLFARWRVPLPPDHPEGQVDWLVGAAVMARLDVLKQIDFFDPAFFLYYDEVDLMQRARDAGWTSLYVPRARVHHAEGAATGVRSGESFRKRRPAYWYRSWGWYFRRHHGRAGALAILAATLTGTVLNQIQRRLRRLPPSGAIWAFWDFATVSAWTILFGTTASTSGLPDPAPADGGGHPAGTVRLQKDAG
ncbi:Glycosyl transferase, group 2 family protein (plasmid) [Rhodovulum sp. P5]|uniref:glycosyltransferase family 2 protein n=1 Tax=Rhodovulum sp. P5 TaxID=1564506 RepID=UPI0009C2A8FD|nr:glycosyltransferase family 2 protein [Rhodovulum sp. P5]ARE42527.1 Glycosyl transferase, group 2 family protein [Rhodovulum sp. P5]